MQKNTYGKVLEGATNPFRKGNLLSIGTEKREGVDPYWEGVSPTGKGLAPTGKGSSKASLPRRGILSNSL